MQQSLTVKLCLTNEIWYVQCGAQCQNDLCSSLLIDQYNYYIHILPVPLLVDFHTNELYIPLMNIRHKADF